MRKLYKIKQTYSIGEAAERLSLTLGDQITPDEVLQLMADGEIGIFWWIGDDYARPVAPLCKLRDDNGYTLGPSRGFIANPAAGEVQRITGVFRICTEVDPEAKNWARRKCAGGYDDIPWEGTIVCDPDGACWELMEHKFDADSKLIYEANRKYPFQNELLVTKAELDRFERQFSDDGDVDKTNGHRLVERLHSPSNDVAQYDARNADLTDREKASLQKQVAALAFVLAEKSAKFKIRDKPNGNQIAEAVGLILDAMPEANRHGLSSASLRASIKVGIELLQGKRGEAE